MPDELGWILQDLAQKRAVDFGSSAVEANIPETRTFLSCSHPSFAETWCKNAVFKKKKSEGRIIARILQLSPLTGSSPLHYSQRVVS